MIEVAFEIPGAAAPQGSKRAIRLRNGRTVLVESSDKVKPFRALAALCAREAWGRPPVRGPVEVVAAFAFTRPKSHLTTKGALRAGAPSHPGKPDVDKLARALLDGLTGVLYVDDAQVVRLTVTKCYALSAGTAVRVTGS